MDNDVHKAETWGDSPSQVIDTPAIHGELSQQSLDIDHLAAAVERMDIRLQAVLYPAPSLAEPNNPEGPQPMRSPLAATLADHNGRIRRLTEALNSLADRVEL